MITAWRSKLIWAFLSSGKWSNSTGNQWALYYFYVDKKKGIPAAIFVVDLQG